MGIPPGISLWKKEKASARGRTYPLKISDSSNNSSDLLTGWWGTRSMAGETTPLLGLLRCMHLWPLFELWPHIRTLKTDCGFPLDPLFPSPPNVVTLNKSPSAFHSFKFGSFDWLIEVRGPDTTWDKDMTPTASDNTSTDQVLSLISHGTATVSQTLPLGRLPVLQSNGYVIEQAEDMLKTRNAAYIWVLLTFRDIYS